MDPNRHSLDERVRLANQLYRDFHTRCFWHCRRDLEITEALIPFVVEGLRAHGGRRGFIVASQLLPERTVGREWEPQECP